MIDQLKDKLFVHFKGNIYRVLTSRVLNDSGGFNVIYKREFPEESSQLYTQTLTRFMEIVYRGNQKYLRFTQIDQNEYKDIVENSIYPCLIYKPENEQRQE